ncbi:MAG: hypothetical protein AAF738_00860, partial [Bacteroidota bacterium]
MLARLDNEELLNKVFTNQLVISTSICKKVILLAVMLTFCVGMAQGQKLLLRLAKQQMASHNYQAAAATYQKILQKKELPEAQVQLATAYRNLGASQQAEQWYAQVVQLPNIELKNYLYYAQMLQRNGKCEQASTWFKRYATAAPNDTRGQYLARSCDYRDELMQKSTNRYEVKRL